MGFSLALDTLCGQSFGAKQHKMVGIHTQRAMVVVLLVSVPLAIIMFFCGRILIILRQDPDISMTAESYAILMIPSLFAYGLLQCLLKFLQAQNIVLPIMFTSGITAIFHLLNCWLFTYQTKLGYRGAALSVSMSYWFNLLLLAFYICKSPACSKTWTGFSKEAWHGLWGFLKLGIPSTCMVCLQSWQFELLLILSGLVSNPKLQTSVMSISQNTSSLVYALALGLSAAISIRISNELGAGNSKAVRLAILSATSTIIIEGLVVGAIMIVGRNIWGHAYSSEAQLVKAVAAMMPWVALSHCMDGLQCVLLGMVRGCGRQKIGAFVCLCSYYLIGIPASILLGFVFHMGVQGLWIGNICAIFVQDLVLLTISFSTNWENQVMKARERVQNPGDPVDCSFASGPNYWICNAHATMNSWSISIP